MILALLILACLILNMPRERHMANYAHNGALSSTNVLVFIVWFAVPGR
jgi:hypothetical protein